MEPVSVNQQSFINEHNKQLRTVKVMRILLFLFFLLVWELSVTLGWIDGFFFSSPVRIIKCFSQMVQDFSIFMHVGITLAETIISFSLVIILSLGVAMLLWLFKSLSAILEPYLVVLNSLPKSALAPLFIVWLGTGMKTIVVAGISVAIFGSIISLYTGFSTVDPDKIKLIYTLGGTKKDILLKVVLPSTVPTILSTMKVNIGLSLVGVVIGEFLAARRGLGYLIIYGSQVFKLDWVMMSIVILCIIAIVLYKIINTVEKHFLNHI